MENLFSKLKQDFKIIRLTEKDAIGQTDHLLSFKELIIANEEMYPNINKWLENKVIPGLKSSERTAFIAYLKDKPIISAVVKKGEHSKFCHLHIDDDLHNNYLGVIFFALMATEVRNHAKEIHFTLPESLWIKKEEFFKSFGFYRFVKAGTQYRLFDEELKCSASFSSVWTTVLNRLPKIMNSFAGYNNTLLLSIKPMYAKSILDGKKRVEIRRKFNKKWEGEKVILYASSPKKALVGEATISQVVTGKPSIIWEKFEREVSCSKEEFDDYTTAIEKTYAIVLDNIKAYKEEIQLPQLSNMVFKNLTPPQSYRKVGNNKSWSEAISIVNLLQNNFQDTNRIFI